MYYLVDVLDDGRTKPKPRDDRQSTESSEYKCIVRATVANKKISTVVCVYCHLFILQNFEYFLYI